MKPLDHIYKGGFFKNRHRLNWRASIVCGAIARQIRFKSVIDIGCAIGDLVAEFESMGKRAMGLEGSEAALPFLMVPQHKVMIWDLRKAMKPAPSFDLALCLEVAEHIEPEYAHVLVENLTSLSSRVLVSIAPPGQKGHHHVNCQDIDYWDALFKGKGYSRHDEIANLIKIEWHDYRHKPGIKAYWHNLHYYEKA